MHGVHLPINPINRFHFMRPLLVSNLLWFQSSLCRFEKQVRHYKLYYEDSYHYVGKMSHLNGALFEGEGVLGWLHLLIG